MRLTRPGAEAAARGRVPNDARNNAIACCRMSLTRIPANATLSRPIPPSLQFFLPETNDMRRFALMLFAGVPSVLAAQGFAVSEHNTCTMGRAGAAAASPCADGSAMYLHPAGRPGLSRQHVRFGPAAIGASRRF